MPTKFVALDLSETLGLAYVWFAMAIVMALAAILAVAAPKIMAKDVALAFSTAGVRNGSGPDYGHDCGDCLAGPQHALGLG